MSIANNSSRSKIFILINCVDGKIDSVLEQIKKIDIVTQVQKTDGAYDLIAILEADTNDELKKTLMHKIRTIDDVKYTLTLRSSLDDEVLG
ncbi:Lrp/AsnC ligand binding domain-containing protein [Candidatus Nitrosotenuis aquarius]|jgi:DNA-binding Lrp family transcriptional regulator|uniref:Lrp/AsnC ligand binding domain-containing protein n=1 Tax=Candidatus Nitrosotenuis aquarius TaxID=1846278 RepID=UPI0013C32C52|nr:Lrp/AsnC ligand binding domain-containing protein [Candidatus Nitrosotenuis aquarius]